MSEGGGAVGQNTATEDLAGASKPKRLRAESQGGGPSEKGPLEKIMLCLSDTWRTEFARFGLAMGYGWTWRVNNTKVALKFISMGSFHATFRVDTRWLEGEKTLAELWDAWSENGNINPQRINDREKEEEHSTFVIRVANPPRSQAASQTNFPETTALKNESLVPMERLKNNEAATTLSEAERRICECLPRFTRMYLGAGPTALPLMLMESLQSPVDWCSSANMRSGSTGDVEYPTAVSVIQGCCRFADNICSSVERSSPGGTFKYDSKVYQGMAFEYYMEDMKMENLLFRCVGKDRTDVVLGDLESCVPIASVLSRTVSLGQTCTGRNQGALNPYRYGTPYLFRELARRVGIEQQLPWKHQPLIGPWAKEKCKSPEQSAFNTVVHENLCLVGSSMLTIAIGALGRAFGAGMLELHQQNEAYRMGTRLQANTQNAITDIKKWMACCHEDGTSLYPELSQLAALAERGGEGVEEALRSYDGMPPGKKEEVDRELRAFFTRYEEQWAGSGPGRPEVLYRGKKKRAEEMIGVCNSVLEEFKTIAITGAQQAQLCKEVANLVRRVRQFGAMAVQARAAVLQDIRAVQGQQSEWEKVTEATFAQFAGCNAPKK